MALIRSNKIETFTIVQDINQIDVSALTSPLFKLTLKPRADKIWHFRAVLHVK